MNAQKMILVDSADAAKYMTNIEGWVSLNGRFFGKGNSAEAAARYEGCTHVPCRDCGVPTEKMWTKCNHCREVADTQRYLSMPEADWDGSSMLYSQFLDRYYADPSNALDDLFNMEDAVEYEDLRLVICEPNYASQLDSDYFCDILDEDSDLPCQIEDAIEEFNKAIAGVIVSWSPGKTRLRVSEPKA